MAMSITSKLSALALLATALAGCNNIGALMGGGAGVMPQSDVGPPPSMRGAMPNRQVQAPPQVDEDGAPLPSTPTRQLALPNSKASTRTAEAGPRRINRDEIEGAGQGGGGSGGVGPSLTPGGVGVGGKF